MAKVEDYRLGYPQYVALLSSHSAFEIFRRFKRMRLRLLLLKQDEICRLEEALDQADRLEQSELYLGCHRLDRNPNRQQILQQLTSALAEYGEYGLIPRRDWQELKVADTMMKQAHLVLTLPQAKSRDTTSLKNWLEGTASISRVESSYLEHGDDLLSIHTTIDNAITRTENAIEDCAIWLGRRFKRLHTGGSKWRDGSRTGDDHIYLPGPRLRTLSRAITTWLAIAALLVPIVILYIVTDSKARIITITLASVVFLSAISLFTKARTVEVITVGASYSAVLVVFTSASNGLFSVNTRCS